MGIRRYIDWIPFQRPKVSPRAGDEKAQAEVYEKNKEFLQRWENMSDEEVSQAWHEG